MKTYKSVYSIIFVTQSRIICAVHKVFAMSDLVERIYWAAGEKPIVNNEINIDEIATQKLISRLEESCSLVTSIPRPKTISTPADKDEIHRLKEEVGELKSLNTHTVKEYNALAANHDEELKKIAAKKKLDDDAWNELYQDHIKLKAEFNGYKSATDKVINRICPTTPKADDNKPDWGNFSLGQHIEVYLPSKERWSDAVFLYYTPETDQIIAETHFDNSTPIVTIVIPADNARPYR